mgnify:FL=1|tara:strand:+ start:1229 stop:1549 length:321 start_codon:yes stop_codon:yes gene_type:complete
MGTYLTGTYTILHTNTTADFDNFVYDAVYFSTADTMTINGVAVTGVLGETLSITVDGNTSILNAGVLLLGNPIAPQTKVQTGLISGDSHNEVWQFVNIKTGLPTNG